MVVSLPKPTVCSQQIIDMLVAERQGGKNAVFFKGISGEWKRRVAIYIARAGSPEFVAEWPDIQPNKNSFLNLYLTPADESAQGRMLATLRDHQLSLCPACGEAGSPNTLDHYLPKGKFPHLCVTPLNLFPMCDACQQAKGEKTGDGHSAKFFIHPYFDVFVAQQVVTLKIESPFETPTFTLSPRKGLLALQAALVETHLRELEIHDRYVRFFRNQYRRLLRLVGKMRISKLPIRENLKLFQENVSDPSPNSWEHIFYGAVLADDGLMHFLEHSELPRFL